MTLTVAETFESLDPRTGDVVGTHPVHDAAAVEAAVALSRNGYKRQLVVALTRDALADIGRRRER